jgi:hypothetical protein
MAQLPIVEFAWMRDPKGYRLTEGKQRRIVRNGPFGTEVACPPLTGEEFRVFANTVTDEGGALDFVTQYGPLTQAGRDPEHGDYVNVVIHQALMMRQVFDAIAAQNGGPGIFVPSIDAHVTAFWDPAVKNLRWLFTPNSLLDALWLQVGQTVTRGVQLRICEHCGDWFEAGAGTGRRAGARFCCHQHQITHNSLKRSTG